MGIAERRQREKERRRNEIIDAAEKVFSSKGFDRATMDDVAEQAELSKGTLYLYFKNKEELYLAVNERGFRILQKMFREAAAQARTGLEKVYAIGQAYFRFHIQYEDYYNAMVYYESHQIDYSDDDSCAMACDRQGEKALEVLVEAIRAGIEDKSIRPDVEPFKMAIVLWGQSTGIIQISLLKGAHIEEKHGIHFEEVVELSFDIIKRALQNTEKQEK
ncbi:MAG TPA: TetR/AcrR family transcriptional regulator [Calditrichaeota bacterium]|nr:TetR/AcrR family transcriptional regulator [Calditrichota bacterium]